jgi:hypothetical protein
MNELTMYQQLAVNRICYDDTQINNLTYTAWQEAQAVFPKLKNGSISYLGTFAQYAHAFILSPTGDDKGFKSSVFVGMRIHTGEWKAFKI